MSALNDPMGGMLNELVETQRGMTEWEADWFLRTGQLPDLSQPPVDEPVLLTDVGPVGDVVQARSFLAGHPLTASSASLAFNPFQKRDKDGRWTDSGISGKSVYPHVRSSRDFTSKYHRDHDNAASSYQSGSGKFNHALRDSAGADIPDADTRAAARVLDEMIQQSPAKKAFTVRRALGRPEKVFGDAWRTDGDNTGLEWVDHGYTSTSADIDFVDDFARDHTAGDLVLMNIQVPKGLGALHMQGSRSFGDEEEVLLARGTRFRVVADHGRDEEGTHRLTVEAFAEPATKLRTGGFVAEPAAPGSAINDTLSKLRLDLGLTAAALDDLSEDERALLRLRNVIDVGPEVEIVARPALTAAFDPNQERDGHGRWTDGGGGGSTTSLQATLEMAPVGIAGSYRGPSLVCRPETLSTCAEGQSRKVLAALLDYRGMGFKDINGLLRRRDVTGMPEPVVRGWIDTIDGAMDTSRLPRDVTVLRGLATGRGIFGNALDFEDDLTGFEWIEKAYVSTTANPETAEEFGEGGVIMHVRVPAGTGGIQLSNAPTEESYDEAELLLERGLKMRVVAERERDRSGRRILDVEVVPA